MNRILAFSIVAAAVLSGALHAQEDPALTAQERVELQRVLAELESYQGPLDDAQAERIRQFDALEEENAERRRQGLPPLPIPAPSPPDPPLEQEFPDGSGWLLVSPLAWTIGGTNHTIAVPMGFTHDKASVPQALQWLVKQSGRYTRAATVHDYLYWKQDCTRLQSDNLMLIAMKETKVTPLLRSLIYRAVRLGGRGAWETNEREREAGLHRIFPWGSVDSETTIVKLRESMQQMGADMGISNLSHAYTVPPEACALGDSVGVPEA